MTEEKIEKTEWVKLKPAEIEKKIIELGKNGETPAKIGLLLRDLHGIPKTKLASGKRIQTILKNSGIPVKRESEKVKGKMENLEKHFAKHKHDYTAKKRLAQHLWLLSKLHKQEA